MFGYRATEVIGRPLTMLMPKRFREAHQAGFERFLATGESRVIGTTLELAGKRKNGSEFPLEISVATWKADRMPHFTAMLRDITSRKGQEIKFRGLVESAPEAVVIADREGRILIVNAQAERLFGYGRAELLGRPVKVLVPEGLRANHVANEVVVARDGAEALEFLFGTGQYAGRDTAILPAVILLDIKLPEVDALEVLERIRSEQRTKLLPVVILTSSREQEDVLASYRLGANSFVRKPIDFVQFSEAVRQLRLY